LLNGTSDFIEIDTLAAIALVGSGSVDGAGFGLHLPGQSRTSLVARLGSAFN